MQLDVMQLEVMQHNAIYLYVQLLFTALQACECRLSLFPFRLFNF